MSPGYKVLPLVYDRWQKSYGKDYSTLILPRVLATIRDFEMPVSTMMDLACGTGVLALYLVRKGWRVWGVDASEGMVAAARAKVRGKRCRVTFLQQDMRYVQLPHQVTLVTSFFDSVNHLRSLRDLRKTFGAVYASLLPGGHFVFDVNNLLCFSTLWTHTETIRHKDFTMVLANEYRKSTRAARSLVTLDVKTPDGERRLTETVCERYFSRDEIRRALAGTGFRIRRCEDFNFTSLPHVGTIKTWWVAQK
jgi:SAM-dependent methyltransferase